ncbi:MAG: glycoside hydrolase family 31 protein [Candidatus Microbacterium phytovorans]|uniref:Glycoside hydrolase family 31 protein n=1 Tax=Candidatus Microbacterium phytovorans TaxID=3121374 RepID=A0AAJ6B2V0_9MICO|nr:TIM-barrel domain-containing protein [Microbacterium sp.]WEK12439.1 MAG: glycoside hydrolase family 31 protein [Microbacterium sp.]
MIRHRPAGSGHPYSVDTEQRHPVVPETGNTATLGVRADGEVTAVTCLLEWVPDDGSDGDETVLDLAPVATTSRGRLTDGGHLASAQSRRARAVGGWQVTTPALRSGGRYRYRFTATSRTGRREQSRTFSFRAAIWQDAPEAVVETGRSRVVAGSVQRLHDGERAWRVRFALPLAAGERVTGFGERFDTLDHTGSDLDSVVFEQYKSQGAERKTYLPMPFAHVVGSEGWGFHVDTSRRVWFDLGRTDATRIAVETETGADGVADLRLFDGAPTDVLSAFLDRVGRAEELPDWVFRLWASGNEWNTQAEVMRQMDLHVAHDTPVGSVVIEAWSDESTFTAFRDAQYEVSADGAPHRLDDFTFPADGAWPDPRGMIDELHGRDVRLHLWQIPLLKMRPHPTGQLAADARAAISEGVLIREPDARGRLRPYRNRGWWFPLSLMPDLTDEGAARWWTEKRRYLVEELGVDGFKTDGGEHAWGAELVYLDGRHGDEKNNTFPVAYAAAYGELLRSAGKAPVTFSRAGFTGSQAHGAFWAGDENSTWEAFAWSMNAGLSAASAGIVYWGWDIAGFSGEIPDSELYIRAFQASTFVPIMQYHSEFNHHRTPSRDRTPWNIAERTGDDRVLALTRTFTHLRERLVPYLAASARETIATDRPLMRPLFFDDPQAWDAVGDTTQWMLGADLLVAPVLAPGARTLDVWIPEGEWVDAWSGEPVASGARVSVPVSIERIPVFVRAGSQVQHAFADVQ